MSGDSSDRIEDIIPVGKELIEVVRNGRVKVKKKGMSYFRGWKDV